MGEIKLKKFFKVVAYLVFNYVILVILIVSFTVILPFMIFLPLFDREMMKDMTGGLIFTPKKKRSK